MDERDDTEAQDDKVNQVKREESVEKTESLRKPTSMMTKYTHLTLIQAIMRMETWRLVCL